jgi:hypothetical protein
VSVHIKGVPRTDVPLKRPCLRRSVTGAAVWFVVRLGRRTDRTGRAGIARASGVASSRFDDDVAEALFEARQLEQAAHARLGRSQHDRAGCGGLGDPDQRPDAGAVDEGQLREVDDEGLLTVQVPTEGGFECLGRSEIELAVETDRIAFP